MVVSKRRDPDKELLTWRMLMKVNITPIINSKMDKKWKDKSNLIQIWVKIQISLEIKNNTNSTQAL
jgi:hypothetical protein